MGTDKTFTSGLFIRHRMIPNFTLYGTIWLCMPEKLYLHLKPIDPTDYLVTRGITPSVDVGAYLLRDMLWKLPDPSKMPGKFHAAVLDGVNLNIYKVVVTNEFGLFTPISDTNGSRIHAFDMKTFLEYVDDCAASDDPIVLVCNDSLYARLRKDPGTIEMETHGDTAVIRRQAGNLDIIRTDLLQ
jgi:hypothetical protein